MCNLIDCELGYWKGHGVRIFFDDQSASTILATSLSHNALEDRLLWLPNPKGHFSVRSVYLCDQDFSVVSTCLNFNWHLIWKLKIQHRHRLMFWKLVVNAFTIHGHLPFTIVDSEDSCFETVQHLFLECLVTRSIWGEAPSLCG